MQRCCTVASLPRGTTSSSSSFLIPGTDDRGSGPGCYVLAVDGSKTSLELVAGGILRIPAQSLAISRNEYVRGQLTLDLGQALTTNPETVSDHRYQLLPNRWNRRWASYQTQDPHQVALHQEVQDVSAPIVE